MRLCFDPVMCPRAVLPAALNIAKAAGFDAFDARVARARAYYGSMRRVLIQMHAGIVDKYVGRIGMVMIGEDDADVIHALKANGYEGPVVFNVVGGSVVNLRVRVEEVLNT